jgi:hypothetical protein
MPTARLLAVAGLAAVALAAGCGEDEPSAAESWAESVCSSAATWKESVTSAGDSIRAGGGDQPVQRAVDDIKAATTTLADDLAELDAPETDSGQQAKELITRLVDDLRADVDAIEQALAEGGVAALTAVTAAVAAMTEQVSSSVEELEQLDARGELADAFDKADSCKELRRSS